VTVHDNVVQKPLKLVYERNLTNLEMRARELQECYRQSLISLSGGSSARLVLSNAGTVETLRTLRDGLNAFCILSWL
jgi:hypothetical protein